MKNKLKYILVILAILVTAGLIYWQLNKKQIIRNALENVISQKTDSLYFIHYDSSAIDELNGNASFFNVDLQADSLQKQILNADSSATFFNIHVGEVIVKGVDIPSLLRNEKVEAISIHIIRPVVYIIQSGTKKEKPFSRNDTLAIYEKLLGKFNSIKAREIIIENGQLIFSEKNALPKLTLNDINLTLKNILIDSTKDYNNLISYFIKDINASVKEIVFKNDNNDAVFTFSNVEYDALKKYLRLEKFTQKINNIEQEVFSINNTEINGLSTDLFILNKQLKAEELISEGGLMTLYSNQAENKNAGDSIDRNNNFFNEALLNKITLGNTRVIIYKTKAQKGTPLVLENVKFTASEIQHLYSGTTIKNMISKSNWMLSADGFSFISKDKMYKIRVGVFKLDKAEGTMHIKNISVTPQLSWPAFVKRLNMQKDLFNIVINNIDLKGIDTKMLLTKKTLQADLVSMEPVLKVFNDRTVPPNPASKVGKYPHQMLLHTRLPIYIKKINVKNGTVSYTERALISRQNGTVFFNHISASLNNVTNINSFISHNKMLTINIKAKFMGVADLQTKWNLPINTTIGEFAITGIVGSFNATKLNPVVEPLGLASIKEGEIKGLDFNINGTDTGASGSSTILYNNLIIEKLKKDSNDLKKQEFQSFMANLLIKDDNPKNGVTRKGEIKLERDKTRSFFNLLWKGVFSGIKRTAMGKNDDK